MQTFVPNNKGLLYHTANKDGDESMGNNYQRNPVFSIFVEASLERFVCSGFHWRFDWHGLPIKWTTCALKHSI